MAIEIERKFLVRKPLWAPAVPGTRYRQGYLSLDPQRTVRVRLAGAAGFLTIKGASAHGARAEYEYPIPAADAEALLALCHRPLIEKLRYRVTVGGHLWEVDEFFGDNAGLLLAEVELTEIGEAVELPEWVGEEVTDDPRYYNAALSQHPFSTWGAT